MEIFRLCSREVEEEMIVRARKLVEEVLKLYEWYIDGKKLIVIIILCKIRPMF